jgi:hypothetical protein
MYVIYVTNLVDIIKPLKLEWFHERHNMLGYYVCHLYHQPSRHQFKPLKGGISYTAKTNSKTHHGLKLLNDLFDSLPINVFILRVSKKTEKPIKPRNRKKIIEKIEP